jgi:hypothetical protein
VQNENPRTNERARNPKRTALSLTIPATLLALADEVMSEKATSVVGTKPTWRDVRLASAFGGQRKSNFGALKTDFDPIRSAPGKLAKNRR